MTEPRTEAWCEESDCSARPHRLVIESHDFSGDSVPDSICDRDCTSSCHATDCEHHGHLAAAPGAGALRDALRREVERIFGVYGYLVHEPFCVPARECTCRHLLTDAVLDAIELAALPDAPDEQRRCWTITPAEDGTAQCRLYNGHDGDHLFGAAPEAGALRDALERILGDAEEVTEYQHGNPLAVLNDVAERARAALAKPEPAGLDVERLARAYWIVAQTINANDPIDIPMDKCRHVAKAIAREYERDAAKGDTDD